MDHKYLSQSWPGAEFAERPVVLPASETTAVKLAERGAWRPHGFGVREIPKLWRRAGS